MSDGSKLAPADVYCLHKLSNRSENMKIFFKRGNGQKFAQN